MSRTFWAVQCFDAPDAAQRRSAVLAEHLIYVKNCPVAVSLAGPLTSADGSQSVGSLLVLYDGEQAEVEAFVRGAPFSKAGVWGDVRISRFMPLTSRLSL